MNPTYSAILAVVVLGVLGAAVVMWYPRGDSPGALIDRLSDGTSTAMTGATSTDSNGNEQQPNQPSQSSTMTVKMALLDTAGSTNGPSRGCDKVVMADRTVMRTAAPLNAALTELFRVNDENVGGYFNFIARTNETLKFDRVTLENGVAKVYLTGSLSGLAGVCDDPRATIQIEETAKQFPTVQRVETYLNGALTNLTPSEKGE